MCIFSDTIYKDIPVIDREESIAKQSGTGTGREEYNGLLFDNEFGKLSIDFVTQCHNELQKLSYSFTPVHREKMIVKKECSSLLFLCLVSS